MKKRPVSMMALAVVFWGWWMTGRAVQGQSVASPEPQDALDVRVQRFLDAMKGRWRALNVPYEDGQVLYDLIVQHHYTRALEIGTSTGHSAIWIAWALSKTGGKLITIEIEEDRYKTALDNFARAGVSAYIDARLADAHTLVKELPGPFDFVFADADKEWYSQYFQDLEPKLTVGGCFTAHNVLDGFAGAEAFLAYVQRHPGYTTTVDRTSRAGIAISCKTAP
jgi:predicted O-methyltransferase YrrM